MIKSPYATSYTRTGVLDMKNRKPYRTPAQKALARELAEKTKNGSYTSRAPVSYHKGVFGKGDSRD